MNLQYIRKPSKRRKAEDWILANNTARDNKFREYEPLDNPFREGIRHDRFKRFYEKICKDHHDYEPIFRDLCEAYGME